MSARTAWRCAATVAAACAGTASASAAPQLSPGRCYPAVQNGIGLGVAALARADLTGDGRADLAVADVTASAVAILPGDGRGGFGVPRSVPAPAGASGVTIADLDGDERPDLAVAGGENGMVTVLRGRASGAFEPTGTYPSGGIEPFQVTAVDFNRDGRRDLVIANGSGTVGLLVNAGDGRFAEHPALAAGNFDTAVESADFNRDQWPDLAVTNGLTGAQVQLLLGDGHGAFAAAAPIDGGRSQEGLAIGDVNRDGLPDILTANLVGGVGVLLGTGGGAFAPLRTIAAGGALTAVKIADVDGDGQADLVVSTAGGAINVLSGDGTGAFRQTASHPTGVSADPATGSPQSILAEDLDGNGSPDVAAAFVGSPDVCILLNRRAAPVPALRLRIRPRRVVRGRPATVRFVVTAATGPVPGASLRIAGRWASTDARGRARLRLTFRRPGVRRVTAAKRGYASAVARLRVARSRQRLTSASGAQASRPRRTTA